MDKTTYDYLKRTTKPIYWNREREKRTRKECELNKKKPFTRFQWLLISLGFKGVNR